MCVIACVTVWVVDKSPVQALGIWYLLHTAVNLSLSVLTLHTTLFTQVCALISSQVYLYYPLLTFVPQPI